MSILYNMEKHILAMIFIYGYRAIFLLFSYHQSTESESREREMSISKPIFTHKNTTGSTISRYLSSTTWDMFWSYFQIFLDVETICFRFSSFVFFEFSLIPLAISQLPRTGWKINPDIISIRNFCLVYLIKYYIRMVSTKIRIIGCHGVLLIWNLHTFWGADKDKDGNLNISINMYL